MQLVRDIITVAITLSEPQHQQRTGWVKLASNPFAETTPIMMHVFADSLQFLLLAEGLNGAQWRAQEFPEEGMLSDGGVGTKSRNGNNSSNW